MGKTNVIAAGHSVVTSAGSIDRKDRRRAAIILTGMAAIEGFWVIRWGSAHPIRFSTIYLGFSEGRAGTPLAWMLATVTSALFIRMAARIPSVRATLFQPSFLKLLAIALAISAGVFEEIIFRKMDDGLCAAFGVRAGR